MPKTWTPEIKLSEQHLKVLRTIASHKDGCTRATARKESRVAEIAPVFGPVYEEDTDAYAARYGTDSLMSLGLIKGETVVTGTESEVLYRLTPKGHEAVRYYRTAKRGGRPRIPAEILDRAVMSMMKSRAYGLERWTRDDLDTLRSSLPGEHIMISLEDLHAQVIVRRKAGAFVDPVAKETNRRMAHVRRLVLSYWQGETPLDEVTGVIRGYGEGDRS